VHLKKNGPFRTLDKKTIMKKIILSFCSLLACLLLKSQSIAINTDGSLPDSKALLDIKSTTKGILIPRMTTAQRNAIGTPPTGLLVFDTGYSNYFFSIGGTWNQIGTGSNTWSTSNGGIYYNSVGGVGIGTSIPYAKFHVNGTSWFQGDNTPLQPIAGQGIAIGYGAFPYIFAYDYLNDIPMDLILQSPGGRVGIGTTSPSGRLNIDVGNLFSGEALRLTGTNPFLSFHLGPNQKGYIWNKNTNDMEFGTAGVNSTGNLFLSIAGTPKLTILNDGRVSIKGNSAVARLSDFTVNGTTTFKASNGHEWAVETNLTPGNPTLDFYLNNVSKASVLSDGQWAVYSDRILKENIHAYGQVLDRVKNLEVVAYTFKSNPQLETFGFIAQEVQKFFPELVHKMNKEGHLGIAYAQTGVIALKAIQEQQVIIEDLKNQIELLRKAVTELQKK
jgi:hypothetical protein